ncbi:type IV toxin-antitoxin system AbiEi family antitoxin domain-containing protein [Streptomyces spirodelae]|uniref:Type IV toxin-antitoxin system AbiEi family antitoxin domain-containing protein n=1 Tax=Streptomyces spirodelae TaxID=2812904 RepID=A0ABS3X1I4_9ACTN|nr:type IV toxin-antitoxin system AbiEi family antitoxin domain-containing protein [Streptomyces spirodelae]MBO8189250.1 type IV toxin-antitoxin system AbiEi family antitoxin domain-containing protein [Streptomyces spirodelae]
MNRAEQLATLSGAAADQWGLVTAAQAKVLGLNAVQLLRLTEAGLLESVGRGVYLLAASGMPQHLDVKVAWLRLQPTQFAWERPAGHSDSGVVSHASACQLHELGDLPAPQVEISVPRRRTTTEPFVRLRTAPVETSEITVIDGLPVTTADRTIVDLLQAKADGGHIGGVIAEADRRDLVSLDGLAARVQPYARKYGLPADATGRALIDHLVAQADESLRSQEVDRASREGFDAAVHLMAERPELVDLLLRSSARRHRMIHEGMGATAAQRLAAQSTRLPGTLTNYPNPVALTGLQKTLRDIQQLVQPNVSLRRAVQNLAGPNPDVTAALRKLTQPDPALMRAIQQAAAASTVKAFKNTTGLTAALKQAGLIESAALRSFKDAAADADPQESADGSNHETGKPADPPE